MDKKMEPTNFEEINEDEVYNTIKEMLENMTYEEIIREIELRRKQNK